MRDMTLENLILSSYTKSHSALLSSFFWDDHDLMGLANKSTVTKAGHKNVIFTANTKANPAPPNVQRVNVMGKTPDSYATLPPLKVSHKGRQAGYCLKPLLTLKSINDMDKALRILIKLLTGFYRCTLLVLPHFQSARGRCMATSTPALPRAVA